MKLSACMIAKNEERCIARCIDSYRKAVDEVVVVDTGSTDRTRAIAKSRGAKVFDFAWQDDFALAKNYALEQANGDWVLFLDADEYFEKNGAVKLRNLLEKLDDDVDGVRVRLYNLERDGQVGEHLAVLRALRGRPDIRYKGAVHEYPQKAGQPLNVVMAPPETVYLYHDGYSGPLSRAKAERNIAILEKELEKDSGDAMLLFYLGQSWLGKQDYRKALEYNEAYLEKEPGATREALRAMLRCERALRMLAGVLGAETLCEKRAALAKMALERFPEKAASGYLAGNERFEAGDFAAALPPYQKALALYASGQEEEDGYSEAEQAGYDEVVRLRVACCQAQNGHNEEAMKGFAALIDADVDNLAAVCGWLRAGRGQDAQQVAARLMKWQKKAKDPNMYLAAARQYRCDLAYLLLYNAGLSDAPGRDEYFTTMQVLVGQSEAAVKTVVEGLAWHPLWCGSTARLLEMVDPSERHMLNEMLADALAGALAEGEEPLLRQLAAVAPGALAAGIGLCLGDEVERFGSEGRQLLPLVAERLAAFGASGEITALWGQVLSLANGEAG